MIYNRTPEGKLEDLKDKVADFSKFFAVGKNLDYLCSFYNGIARLSKLYRPSELPAGYNKGLYSATYERLDSDRYRFKDVEKFMKKEEHNGKFDDSAEIYTLFVNAAISKKASRKLEEKLEKDAACRKE